MSTVLYRLGRSAVRHRRWVVAAWLAAVVLLAVAGGVAGGEFNHDSFGTIPGSDSRRASELLERTLPERAGSSAQVVVYVGDGTLAQAGGDAALADAVARMEALPHVVSVDQQLSEDGATALVTVRYDQSAPDLGTGVYHQLQATAAPLVERGLAVDYGGEVPQNAEEVEPDASVAVGLLAAALILLLAFGSVIAMGLPIGTAVVGLAAGSLVIALGSAVIDLPADVQELGALIGLGVGIDYSLLIITRHRAGLHRGLTVEDAAGRAIATAGQAVLIAGATVVISIFGLAIVGISNITLDGAGAALVVAVMVLAAVTLLPALLGFAGHNVDRFGLPGRNPRVEPATVDAAGRAHGWARWSRHVSRHPVVYLVGSVAVLLALAAPALDLRLGQPDDGTLPESSTLRRGYDQLAAAFGPGFNGPLLVAVDRAGDEGAPEAVRAALAADPGIAAVSDPVVSGAGDSAVIQVEPASAPQDAATDALVHRLRDTVLPDALRGSPAQAHVGGQTAFLIDLSARINDRLPWFMGAVIGLSFLLLMVVFRSIVVPLKAAAMNVLSVGAAYGVIVAVFQKGWGASLFGVHESLPIVGFLPFFVFAVLFGLSMDYEVFLLSRVREEYLSSGDNTQSIVAGITTTARVITSAALVMIAVFASFTLGADPVLKMFGLGFATGILVDATVVRMALVPAALQLMGRANWWLPRGLDRRLPRVDIEGETRLPPPEARDVLEPVGA
ncbi:MAG TPA: MMPL family transporter [Acidimicrobiales bacterium]